MIARIAPVPLYFCLRVAAALLLLKLSASFLPVSGFSAFTQLILFAGLLNLAAIGGTQNGLIRQAAAARDAEARAAARRAAFRIWHAVAPALGIAIALGSMPIARILVGTSSAWPAVIAIAALVLAAGPGQIWCSLLTGRGRVSASLAAQAAGLVAATALAGSLVARGHPIAAAICFATGPAITMLLAWPLAAKHAPSGPGDGQWRVQARHLLRYSAAFVAAAGSTSLLLFGLRFVYRERFGAEALGWWMAANRISDLSTQLLGLFLIQAFVPHLATLTGEDERRAFVLRCWAAAAAVMAIGLLAFMLASVPLVRLFLSDAYLPAIPMIRTYLAGDLLRVWASLAMFAAFAAGRPGRYAGIEIATMALMAAITLALIRIGLLGAPAIGYAGAYGAAAVAVTIGFMRPLRRPAALRLRQRER